ncbi:nucleotide sugar dehydrogenase [Celeribacter baekdonensis]|uniref:nucleotide sugar dehydrogenase n=1 Tax=Celeribacter baekdonensis TaxID=875171 RepID=UPI003A90B2DD
MEIKNIERHDAKIAASTGEVIGVIGLGYVGLPLAVRMAEVFDKVIGFDISERRITRLNEGVDDTREVDPERLVQSGMYASYDPESLRDVTFFIVAVPTPITEEKRPDLSPLEFACNTIGPYLKKGDVVVFESTVYPGVTEDFCGGLLEKLSGLKAGVDFNLGYSPERINPGDKVNTVETIVKNVSADTPEALDRVAAVYDSVVTAGVYRCSSIRVAEAAKVMENTQRDVNIALMNELSIICHKIGISANDVIDAASTKWNFIGFRPGLVGGHCIGVDPYYIAALAERSGHHPEVILAGRRLNDAMDRRVASALLQKLVMRGGSVRKARVGFLGISFKENVPDLRNSKYISLVHELREFGLNVMVSDCHCMATDAMAEGIELVDMDQLNDLDMLVLGAGHEEYMADPGLLNRLREDGIFADIQGRMRTKSLPEKLTYWSL